MLFVEYIKDRSAIPTFKKAQGAREMVSIIHRTINDMMVALMTNELAEKAMKAKCSLVCDAPSITLHDTETAIGHWLRQASKRTAVGKANRKAANKIKKSQKRALENSKESENEDCPNERMSTSDSDE
ncbi:hypothetical protein B566_EDAN014200 [Ephemera danica]|nr:hypothetical protein B566_EDAN014200 [Ephemera danica]